MTIALNIIDRAIGRIIFLISVVMALLFSASVRAQTSHLDTLRCGRRVTIDLGSVLAGGTLTDSLSLVNLDSAMDTVFNIKSPTDSGFSWTKTNNIHILQGPFEYATTISFSPPDSELGTASTPIVFEPTMDSSCQTTFEVSTTTVGPSANNSTVPLDNNPDNIIAFKTNTPGDTIQLQLQNKLETTLPVESLSLQNDTAFQIISSSITFPDTLPVGGFFLLKLAFVASKPGFYTDFITMPGEPIIPLSVQGLLEPKDAVETQPTGSICFMLYPNPSQGLVTIHTENITQAHVTITDVLGRTLTETSFTGDWQWDRSGSNGIAPSGTYFVIITGTGSNGEPVHEVKRVVLE